VIVVDYIRVCLHPMWRRNLGVICRLATLIFGTMPIHPLLSLCRKEFGALYPPARVELAAFHNMCISNR
jgi:hypothetical protein